MLQSVANERGVRPDSTVTDCSLRVQTLYGPLSSSSSLSLWNFKGIRIESREGSSCSKTDSRKRFFGSDHECIGLTDSAMPPDMLVTRHPKRRELSDFAQSL